MQRKWNRKKREGKRHLRVCVKVPFLPLRMLQRNKSVCVRVGEGGGLKWEAHTGNEKQGKEEEGERERHTNSSGNTNQKISQ
jgi:hypothetical protein